MPAGEPVLYLQLADREGIVAQYRAGGRAEIEFIQTCADAIVRRGVGILRTEAHVAQDISDGITEAIRALKKTAIHTTAV